MYVYIYIHPPSYYMYTNQVIIPFISKDLCGIRSPFINVDFQWPKVTKEALRAAITYHIKNVWLKVILVWYIYIYIYTYVYDMKVMQEIHVCEIEIIWNDNLLLCYFNLKVILDTPKSLKRNPAVACQMTRNWVTSLWQNAQGENPQRCLCQLVDPWRIKALQGGDRVTSLHQGEGTNMGAEHWFFQCPQYLVIGIHCVSS